MESQDDQTKEATRCQPTQAEDFSGSKGALSSLTSGHGDVAFVPHTVLEKIKHDNTSDIKISDLMLLCSNGGVSSIDKYQDCNLGYEPPRVIVSHAGKSDYVLEKLTHGVLTATSLLYPK
ncbi:transferrin-like [Cotesia glomerata]|uniref:transferrin-like n=1 Tax=Cotesia glomerata TaxID=32391 RepID=UPI001D030C44|nr:transferrin-like [Cotesia glomerata]